VKKICGVKGRKHLLKTGITFRIIRKQKMACKVYCFRILRVVIIACYYVRLLRYSQKSTAVPWLLRRGRQAFRDPF
jgi:hypothetical protein